MVISHRYGSLFMLHASGNEKMPICEIIDSLKKTVFKGRFIVKCDKTALSELSHRSGNRLLSPKAAFENYTIRPKLMKYFKYYEKIRFHDGNNWHYLTSTRGDTFLLECLILTRSCNN